MYRNKILYIGLGVSDKGKRRIKLIRQKYHGLEIQPDLQIAARQIGKQDLWHQEPQSSSQTYFCAEYRRYLDLGARVLEPGEDLSQDLYGNYR